jgi:hypothetical protein
MSPLGLFPGGSDGNIEGFFGTTLARSWYMADDPPSHSDLGAQVERLSLLLSDQNRIRAAGLHAAYNLRRSQITGGKPAIETLEQQYYKLQGYITPVSRLPAEIVTEIFRIVLNTGRLRIGLMLVCQRWWKIVEGMVNIWTSLDLGSETTQESVQYLLSMADKYPLAVKIDIDKARSTAESLHSYLPMVAKKASQWQTLTICSLPQNEQDAPSDRALRALRSMKLQPMRQLRHLNIKEPVLSPVLRRLLQSVATTAVETLRSMEIYSFTAVQYLLQPAHAPIYSSLTTFIAKVPKMNQPLDLLPHFMQLKVLDLTNLLLPVFDNSTPLPLARTLHHLSLKAVSIQWMGGREFSRLENCTIIAPLTGPSLHNGVQLPACTKLHFENWGISPNGQFVAPALNHLKVTSNTWSPYKGDRQVIQLGRAGFGMTFRPKSLFLSVACKETVLLTVLELLPGLVELTLDLPRPSALGKNFFTALLVKPEGQLERQLKFRWSDLFKENTTGWACTLCPSLTTLELKYQRWLRPGDSYDFLPPLFALSWCRGKTETPLQLLVNYKSSVHRWESFDPMLQATRLRIVQDGQIARLSLRKGSWKSEHEDSLITPFLSHLQVFELPRVLPKGRQVLNALPSFHQLRELWLCCIHVPPLAHDVDLPLVRTLRKLRLRDTTLDWMDGRVFTKLQMLYCR